MEREITFGQITSEKQLIEILKRAEEQIKNGEVTDAETAYAEMRRKYGI